MDLSVLRLRQLVESSNMHSTPLPFSCPLNLMLCCAVLCSLRCPTLPCSPFPPPIPSLPLRLRRCYLVQRQRAEQLGRAVPGFTRWVDDRRELNYLLNHANLNT